MKKYNVIGLMSGSSMDGLDIVYCRYTHDDNRWEYEVLKSEVIEYPKKWHLRLTNLVLQNAITYLKTDVFYGKYTGELVNAFIEEQGIDFDEIDFIASHGQTIFHQPENGVTSQIGHGAAIAAETGLPVVCDFRMLDVACGGNGAPIVPVGEKLLFPEYKVFLNIGGIANVSLIKDDGVVGFDICPANMILNKIANELQVPYDADGEISRTGTVNQELLEVLNNLWYYEKPWPKTLGGGWVSKVMYPVLKRKNIPPEDKLRTLIEHIAMQISKDLKSLIEQELPGYQGEMMVTGGGAFNKFLMERLTELSPVRVVIPDFETVKFKEAIIIGLLGVLRVRNEVNVLGGVTGASCDTIGGAIYQGTRKILAAL